MGHFVKGGVSSAIAGLLVVLTVRNAILFGWVGAFGRSGISVIVGYRDTSTADGLALPTVS